MMFDDKKKSINVIMGKLKPAEKPVPPDAEVDDSMPKEAAAEELLSAIESKSPKALLEAMESLMELCSSKSEPEGE